MSRRVTTAAIALCLSLVAVVAWSYWSADTVAGGGGAAAAATVGQGATPTAVLDGTSVMISWDATTLSNGEAVTGYTLARYDAATQAQQTILAGCAGTLTATTCTEHDIPTGSWTYAVTPVVGASWRGPESAKSAPVSTDVTPPANAITLSTTSSDADLAGTTVYYRGSAAGSLRLTNAVTDAGSGPASSATSALAGGSAGWSHTPSTVSTPAAGPYQSAPFTWVTATTSSPTVDVTGRDVAGNTAVANLTFVNDSTAPTAGTVSYADGFTAGRSVSVAFTAGTDGGSGVATRRLQRAAAPLTNGTCGSYGSFAAVGSADPTSPYLDSGLAPACYRYRYVVTDRVGNADTATSSSVVMVGYAGAVSATPGLLSHWRFGEGAAGLTSSDSFTGASGSSLTSHAGEIGAGWTHHSGLASAVITDAGRVRGGGVLGASTLDYASAVPASADYSVEADFYVRSNLNGDAIGVVGRLSTSSATYYTARWEQSDRSWNLARYTNGSISYLSYVANEPTLVVGDSYRVRLEMVGSALKLYVNGVLKVSATDGTITAAGRAGIMDDGAGVVLTAKNNTTGIHLDNFQVSAPSYPRAADSKGSNTGDYKNGVTLGIPGALASDANTAATFDGVNDYVQMAGTTGIPTGAAVRSTELWFKTSSAARQVLFRYGSGANTQEYGLWVNAGGTSMTAWGFGNGNDKVFTLPAAVNNGSWHHVVQTYNGTSLTIYIDGVALPAQAATRSTVMDAHGFGVGAVVRQNDGNTGGFFAGSIDEVSFYTTVLSQATVTDHYQLGTTPAGDLTGPTGGSVDATGLVGTGGRYSTTTVLSLDLANGTDPSGLATAGAELRRATATLTDGSCGTFGGYAAVPGGNDPVSPMSDTVADQACYRYEYVVHDTVGNATTYTSPSIKVDSTAPAAPGLAFSAFTNAYWGGSGSTVYYRSAAAVGGFTTTASATDSGSGIASYAFPALGAGWTSTPGSLGATTYSWTGAAAAPGTKQVTATNNAGASSASSPFTLTADDTAPGAGTISYVDGSTTGTSVTVSFTTGTDADSGVGTRLLQRASAPLSGITCGTFGAFATVTNGTNPISPVVDDIAAGSCYKYRYVVSDRVGNEHVATSTAVAHPPYGARWTFDQGIGTSAPDSSGNGNTATLQAGASWTAGRVGANALNLTGASNSFVSAPAPVIDSSRSYSVAAWVRPSNLAAAHQTVVAIDGNVISPFYLQIASGQYVFALRHTDSTSAALTTATGVAATVGVWTHLVAVHDDTANTVSLYVDGTLRSTVAFNSPWKANGATTVGRARWNSSPVDFFSGAIDDVHLYDRALTAAEVAQRFSGG